MFLLVSGEGPGDIGRCRQGEQCEGVDFEFGPMAIIVDQLVEQFQGYALSHLTSSLVSFVAESYLAANRQPALRHSMRLSGKKKPKETAYFYQNARALAAVAKTKSAEVKAPVIAVLFRDCDGTASAGRGIWQDKRNSMIEGFRAEGFQLGVAMIPNPKSEAWLLCATQQNNYQHCAQLEQQSGNDKSPNPLKVQLAASLNGNACTATLNAMLEQKDIDVTRIDMPSFNTFKEDLRQVVQLAMAEEKRAGMV